MAALTGLPAAVQQKVRGLPKDVQERLLELHETYSSQGGLDEDTMEAFEFNKGALTLANLPLFQEFLQEEFAKAEIENAQQRKKELVTKRPRNGTVPLPNDAQATPDAKRRAKEGASKADGVEDASSGTPDPLPRPARATVSLKCSVNEGLVKPTARTAPLEVKLLGEPSLWQGTGRGGYAFMDEPAQDRAAHLDARLLAMEGPMTKALCERYATEEGAPEPGIVGLPSQAEVVLCGRIACESLEGKMNESSLVLEGSRGSSNCAKVQLNVAGCSRIAAFPGQIASVIGRSGASGTTFHARELLPGLPAARVPEDATKRAATSLHAVVAAGPFATRDELDFTPLAQLLAHALHTRPQALVLCGPFLDLGNLMVASGDCKLPGSSEPLSLEEIYQRGVLTVLKRGIEPLRALNPPVEVFLIPSLEEALSFHPLPQPPLDVLLGLGAEAWKPLRSLGVRLLPNPAHLSLGGHRVSIVAQDALSPLLRDLVLRPPERKIEEALRLLLLQRSLFPALPRDPALVSEGRAEALDFPDGRSPDICVFPSPAGGASATVVDDCIFVNPGALCRATRGTFAELFVLPAEPGAAADTPLRERVRVDILKLGN